MTHNTPLLEQDIRKELLSDFDEVGAHPSTCGSDDMFAIHAIWGDGTESRLSLHDDESCATDELLRLWQLADDEINPPALLVLYLGGEIIRAVNIIAQPGKE